MTPICPTCESEPCLCEMPEPIPLILQDDDLPLGCPRHWPDPMDDAPVALKSARRLLESL